MHIVIIVLLLFAISCACSSANKAPTLQLVHAIFRHGSRTPDPFELYPNDPHKHILFHPEGQLTNKGKQEAYELGIILRERYREFFGECYNTHDVVFTQTTDLDRTKMSALSLLAGLFPPAQSNRWNSNLNWQPIPYYYEQYYKDYVFMVPEEYCPAYKKEYQAVLESEFVKEFKSNYSATFEYLSNHTGKQITELVDALYVFHVLYAEENMNLTLPNWTKSVYPSTLGYLGGMELYIETKTTLLNRLYGGKILKIITQNMVQKSMDILSPPGRKIYLYSAHDINIASSLAALNLFKVHIPEYCSAVLIELHRCQATQEYYVKVIYLKNVYSAPEELRLPGCGFLCPFRTFLQIVAPHIPNNITEECKSEVSLE